MYHPNFAIYTNEYLDLTLRDLDDIRITVPIQREHPNELDLAVCTVEIGHQFTDGYRDIAGKHFDWYVRGLERRGNSLSKKLSGSDPEQYQYTRANLTQHYPRPTRQSLDIGMSIALGDQDSPKLTSCERTHLGALYSAIFNGGYVIHNRRVATFKSSYLGHFPHFKPKRLVALHPYPKKKTHQNDTAATVA